MFEVINGGSKPAIDKYPYYMRAYERLADKISAMEHVSRDDIKRLAFYGVKTLGRAPDPKTLERAQSFYREVDFILAVLGVLTPNEVLNIFPIDKDFDGHKWECKDYFYTVKALKGYDMGASVGERIHEFMWDYMNDDLFSFESKYMGVVSDILRFQGEKGILERWAEENDVKMHYLHTDEQGRQWMSDGETVARVHKKIPRHLKVVK